MSVWVAISFEKDKNSVKVIGEWWIFPLRNPYWYLKKRFLDEMKVLG